MNAQERAAIWESRNSLATRITEKEEQHKTEIAADREILRAYDLVLSHAQSANGQVLTEGEPAIPRSRIFAPPGYGFNTKVVRQAIESLAPRDPFTIRRIHGILSENGILMSIQAVTTVMNRLREDNEIVVRREGKGRRPTAFVKA